MREETEIKKASQLENEGMTEERVEERGGQEVGGILLLALTVLAGNLGNICRADTRYTSTAYHQVQTNHLQGVLLRKYFANFRSRPMLHQQYRVSSSLSRMAPPADQGVLLQKYFANQVQTKAPPAVGCPSTKYFALSCPEQGTTRLYSYEVFRQSSMERGPAAGCLPMKYKRRLSIFRDAFCKKKILTK